MATKTVEAELLDLEKRYWRAIKEKDADAAMSLTDEPCIVTGAQGVGLIDRKTLGAMIKGAPLPFHNVYLGTAIAAGSLVGSWMNDAGFWVFSKIGVVTEVETLRSWTPLLAVVGVVSLLTTLLMASVLPLR